MYEIIRSFYCNLTGIRCVIVKVYGREICLEEANMDDQIVEALRLGRYCSVCTYVVNVMPSGKHRSPCTSIVELDMR